MPIDTATLALALGVAVAVGSVPLWKQLDRRRRIRERMRRIDLFGTLREEEQTAAVKVQDESGDAGVLAALLDRFYPLSGGVRTGLAVLIGAAVAAFAMMWVLAFFGLALPFALLGGIALGVFAGWNIGVFREGGMRVKFADRLLAVVDDLQRMVRAGMPVAEAFRTTAEAAGDPVGASLRRVGHATGVGVPLATALDMEARRIRISDLAMLAAIFGTQSRVGGGIAESVGNLADMLRERKDNRSRLKSATAESKLSLIVLSGVPFAAIAIQGVSKPEIFDLLLGEARHLLGIGMGLVVLGLATAYLLVRRVRR